MAEKKEAAPVAKQTVALKYVGEGTYHGGDDAAGGRAVSAANGRVVMVTEAKAAQLQKDFPKDWEKATAKDAAASAKEETQSEEAQAAPAAAAAPAETKAEPKAKAKGKKK